MRYERLDDEGLFGGIDQVLQEATLTAEYKLADGFLARGEFRRDWSNERFFPGRLAATDLRHGQNTALVGGVWWFGNKTRHLVGGVDGSTARALGMVLLGNVATFACDDRVRRAVRSRVGDVDDSLVVDAERGGLHVPGVRDAAAGEVLSRHGYRDTSPSRSPIRCSSSRACLLGRYMCRVFTGQRTLLDPVLVPDRAAGAAS